MLAPVIRFAIQVGVRGFNSDGGEVRGQTNSMHDLHAKKE
jgi:hypothetical protein